MSPQRNRARHRKLTALVATAVLAASLTILPGSALAATIVPVTNDSVGATALATAMLANSSVLTGASFAANPGSGTPDGTSDALSVFPTNGLSFGILTSGDVNLADDPNSSGGSGADLNGGNVRGDTDFDVSILKLDLAVPAGANCLLLDFAFYSDEFPEYVGSSYNDAFIAELDTSNWTTASTTITAPNNFAFDSGGDVVSINSTGATSMNAANAAGTTYDGATVLLQAASPITSGAHSLFLSIFDQGDQVLDSAAFIDNIRLITVPNVATDCVKGATPASNTKVSYTGPASVQYSDPVTLSGHLETQTGTPVAGESLGFTLGTDTASGGPTDASGNASAPAFNVLQQPGSVTTVGVSFAGDTATDPDLLASSSSSPFAITKEDCTLAYTGDTLVNAANMTTLSAQFGEPDATPGAWANKTITFTVTDAALVTYGPYTAVTNALGVASTTAALGPNVYAVSVSFAGDDFYLPCATATDTLVTVSAANAKITGGGWISQTTGRTSFGFNVIQDVTGLKGQLQVRIRSGKDRFHSTSVLTLNSSGNSGTWTGTGRWNGITGYSFTVSVVDNGTSGKKGDTISIVIKSPANATVFTTSGPQPLKGGNIVVH